MYSVRFYMESDKEAWDNFVKNSVNGTFLHCRSYMDYHKDRFEDASLILFDEKNCILALLPANKKDQILYSHQGLTYGGLIHSLNINTAQVIDLFKTIVDFLLLKKYKSLYYKTIPRIYHKYPSDSDVYALFLQGATVSRRDTYSVIDFKSDDIPALGSQRIRALKKATKAGVCVSESSEIEPFYLLLENVLMSRHEIKPTHSLDELKALKELFPENMHVYECCLEGELLAGILVYKNERTVHAQYIATSEEGQKYGALDFLFVEVINKYKKDFHYFSFGISNEDNGLYLNKGLVGQKEGFGARSIVHDHYFLNLEENFNCQKVQKCFL